MSALETFKAGELFQIAFIVRDLDAALERYSAMLNAGPWRCWTLTPRTTPTSSTWAARPTT